jgi:hypothetical protein
MGLPILIEHNKNRGTRMNLRHIPSRIELGFWQVTINLLSESILLQKLIRWFYLEFRPQFATVVRRFERQRLVRWAAAGLGMGLLFGFIAVLL